MNHWHTSYLNKFQSDYLNGVVDVNNIVSDKVAKKVFDEIVFGREVEIDKDNGLKEKYFVKEEIVDEFPIKLQKGNVEFSYQQKVYKYVTNFMSVKFKDKKEYSYREFVDMLADYKHSEPDYWTLAKIIVTCAYFDKLNTRIVSEASFGKDSLVNIMQLLIGQTSKIVNPTIAKLKFRLLNKVIVLNETSGLKKEDANKLSQFLLSVGDFAVRWENDTRAKAGTKEVYNIENNSFLIFHNVKSYYENKGMSYFNEQFTNAVIDRFRALEFRGMVTEDFSIVPEQDDDFNYKLKKMIRTAKYFMNNNSYTRKYQQNVDFDYTKLEKQRTKRNFDTITKWIDRYSKSQEEYDKFCSLLKEAKLNG